MMWAANSSTPNDFLPATHLAHDFSLLDHRSIHQDHDFFYDFVFRLPLSFHYLLRRTLPLGYQNCILPACDISTQG